jgi:peptidoglycan hydrolase CwlO-like protein
MRNQTALEELSAKILLLLEKYNKMKDENLQLSKELEDAKKKIEEQSLEIVRLQEEDELKIMEIEDITQRITKMLA